MNGVDDDYNNDLEWGGLKACICLEPMVCFFLLIFLLTLFIYLDYHPHGTQWRRMGGDRIMKKPKSIIQWTINEYIFFGMFFFLFLFFFTLLLTVYVQALKERIVLEQKVTHGSLRDHCPAQQKHNCVLAAPFSKTMKGKFGKRCALHFNIIYICTNSNLELRPLRAPGRVIFPCRFPSWMRQQNQ